MKPLSALLILAPFAWGQSTSAKPGISGLISSLPAPPALSTFTQANFQDGTSASTTPHGYISFQDYNSTTGTALSTRSMLVKTLSAQNYTLSVVFYTVAGNPGGRSAGCGLVLFKSATGQTIANFVGYDSESNAATAINYFDSLNGDLILNGWGIQKTPLTITGVKIVSTSGGTVRDHYYTPDYGETWVETFPESWPDPSYFIVPDKVGVVLVDSNSSTAACTITGFRLTYP